METVFFLRVYERKFQLCQEEVLSVPYDISASSLLLDLCFSSELCSEGAAVRPRRCDGVDGALGRPQAIIHPRLPVPPEPTIRGRCGGASLQPPASRGGALPTKLGPDVDF